MITPAIAAQVLGCDPAYIRVAARDAPEQLGFPVVRIGRRTKIPREAFVRYMEGGENMSWQKDAIAAARLPVRELVQRLKPAFPRISAPAVSVALNPGESGVTFTPSASKAIAAITGYKRPRRDKRRCPIRIQCRLTEADRDEFNRARVIMGHDTVDEAVKCALHWYIRTANKIAAANSATVRDGTGKCPIASITSKEAVVYVQT